MQNVPRQSGILGSVNWRDPVEAALAIKDVWATRDLKRDLEARAARNAAWLDGRQQWGWNDTTRRMQLPTDQALRNQLRDYLVYNILNLMVSKKISKMNRADPTWSVIAFTADEFDQMVARFSNDLLAQYYSDPLGMPEINERLIRLMLSSPVVFAEPTWDPLAGEVVSIQLDDFYRDIPDGTAPEIANQMRSEDLAGFRKLSGAADKNPGYITQYSGDVRVNIRTIWDTMWWPFNVTSWDQVHGYLVSVVVAPEEASQRYGIPLDQILKWRKGGESAEYYEKIISGWSSPWIDTPTLSPEQDNGVIVHMFYGDKVVCPPSPDNPKGGCQAVLIGNSDRAIKLGPLNNALGVLPLIPFVEHPSTVTAWGTSSIDHALPAQKELNDLRTDKARWRRNSKIKPKMIRSRADGNPNPIEALRKTDSFYEVSNMAEAPKPMIGTPSDTMDEENDTSFNIRHIHDVMGVPDVALGRTSETGVKAWRAVVSLQEEAAEQIKLVGRALNRGHTRIGTFVLAELQQKAVGRRLTAISGENGKREAVWWSRASLRPTMYEQNPAMAATVNVSTFTNLPSTTAEIQQIVMTLFEMGILNASEHGRMIADAFGMNDFRTILDQGRSGRDKAQVKVEQWRSGMHSPPVMRTDDHAEAVTVIRKFMASDDYFEISQYWPEIAQEVAQHLELHEQGVYDEQARQSARAFLAQAKIAKEFAAIAMVNELPGAQAFFMQQVFGVMNEGMAATTDARGSNEQQAANEQQRQPGGAQQAGQSRPPRQSEIQKKEANHGRATRTAVATGR